jgi:gliding motility-associated protein GldM
MKKTILFSLMLVLALGLFSCSGKEKEKKSAKETSEETTSQESSIPGTAFALVDDGLHEIITTMEEDNADIYRHFQVSVEQNPEKVQCCYDKAVSVRKVSNEFYAYVQNFKDEMVEQAEGEAKPNAHVRDLKKQDDTNVPQRYAINEGNAAILKGKINEYREFMIDITGNSPALDEELRQTFTTPDGVNAEGEPISWEDAMFNEMPICASLTVLTKLQNDIRYCEGRAIRYLLTQTDASDLRANKFEAYVIPVTDYVLKGSEYKAQIVLAALDSTQRPEYYVDGELVQNGYYRVKTDKVGKHTLRGWIAYKNQFGETINLPFEKEYTVAEPSATISNTESNILYRGYKNPFSISVPGVSTQDIDVKCAGASITKSGKEEWIITPNSGSADKLTVQVYAKMDGRTHLMGSFDYRIKNLPSPNAYFEVNGVPLKEDKISLSALTNKNNKLIASYGTDGLIQAKFDIVSFRVQLPTGREISVQGSRLNDKAINEIRKLKGCSVTLKYIKAKGPDGKEIQLRSLPLEVN